MGGKKRPESIRSARKDGICVSAVGDQRIGSSRSAGVSLGHARSESHSSVSPFALRSPTPPPRTLSSFLSRSFFLIAFHQLTGFFLLLLPFSSLALAGF